MFQEFDTCQDQFIQMKLCTLFITELFVCVAIASNQHPELSIINLQSYKVLWLRTQLKCSCPAFVCFICQDAKLLSEHYINGSVDLIDKLNGDTPDPAGRECVRTSSTIDCLKWHHGSYKIDAKNFANASSVT